MVSYCMVPGCSVRTRKRQKVSFHALPRDVERCKQWLRAINHPIYIPDTAMEDLKNKKVCSIHFKKEDFELNVLGMKRVALLNTAIPSVFTFPEDEDQPGVSGSSSAKRSRLETQTVSAPALVSSKNGERSLLTSPPVKKPTPVQKAVVSPCPSAPGSLNTSASSIEVCLTDESNQPESTNPPTSSSSEEEEEEEGVQNRREKKIIVKKSSFASLFKFCHTCGKPNTF